MQFSTPLRRLLCACWVQRQRPGRNGTLGPRVAYRFLAGSRRFTRQPETTDHALAAAWVGHRRPSRAERAASRRKNFVVGGVRYYLLTPTGKSVPTSASTSVLRRPTLKTPMALVSIGRFAAQAHAFLKHGPRLDAIGRGSRRAAARTARTSLRSR